MQRISIDKAINTLSLGTILALGEMQFRDKARAIRGVQSANLDDSSLEEMDIDLDDMVIKPGGEIRVLVTEDRVFVAGLEEDHDPTDPTDGDYVGKIHHAGDEEYMEAFGYMPGASGPYPNVEMSEVAEIAAELVIQEVRKDRALWMRLHRMLKAHGQAMSVADALTEGVMQANDSYGLDWRVLGCSLTGAATILSVPDEDLKRMGDLKFIVTEDLFTRAWEIGKERGTVGNPLAVLLDVYEHSGKAYSLHGHGMQCRWDTSRGGAAWVPDKLLEEELRNKVQERAGAEWETLSLVGRTHLLQQEAREACARQLQEYNDWINGDAWGIVEAVFDRNTGKLLEEEACWGYIGSRYAEAEMESNVLHAAKRHLEARNAH